MSDDSTLRSAAAIHLHLTYLEEPHGQMNGATFTIQYDEGREAEVGLSGMRPAIPDSAPYDGLRLELQRLARALENASITASRRSTGSVFFIGREPFELLVQSQPKAHSEGDVVTATMAVFAAGFPQSSADIQVRMTLEQTEALADQLGQVLAKSQGRKGA